MSKGNQFVFIILHVMAWIIFVGLSIEAGGLIVNFVFSLFKPEFVKNLYQTLDLSEMYARSKWAYFSTYSFILIISILKAILFYEVIRLLMKIDMAKPFSSFVSKKISYISYYTLSIGLISLLAGQSAKKLLHQGFATEDLSQFWGDSQGFILMAAVVYTIAIIFKRGVEIQTENDLTV